MSSGGVGLVPGRQALINWSVQAMVVLRQRPCAACHAPRAACALAKAKVLCSAQAPLQHCEQSHCSAAAQVAFPGAYRCVCVRIKLSHLAVAAIVKARTRTPASLTYAMHTDCCTSSPTS